MQFQKNFIIYFSSIYNSSTQELQRTNSTGSNSAPVYDTHQTSNSLSPHGECVASSGQQRGTPERIMQNSGGSRTPTWTSLTPPKFEAEI